jgi:hypothetical protein
MSVSRFRQGMLKYKVEEMEIIVKIRERAHNPHIGEHRLE